VQTSINLPNHTEIPNIILDEWIKGLSGTEFKIAIAIARHAGSYPAIHNPSIDQLCELTGCSIHSVRASIKRLLSMGLITRIKRNHESARIKESSQVSMNWGE
jgi:DNA-binding MarR family transcriptional regulator